ncbi:chromate transport protein ChrA [Pseudonocardia antarctica]|uniref:Chromate transport protein ChrA n=2 Tax=Pseudonocardia alni TaxID=33907 RepID=A0A852W2A3_PSEA5|nr:chromate transport protein ChrA [Pseudonocardia antarctica]OJG05952.1 hypothetical protein BG618_03555 [Pseudonocardia autotrophica]
MTAVPGPGASRVSVVVGADRGRLRDLLEVTGPPAPPASR